MARGGGHASSSRRDGLPTTKPTHPIKTTRWRQSPAWARRCRVTPRPRRAYGASRPADPAALTLIRVAGWLVKAPRRPRGAGGRARGDRTHPRSAAAWRHTALSHFAPTERGMDCGRLARWRDVRTVRRPGGAAAGDVRFGVDHPVAFVTGDDGIAIAAIRECLKTTSGPPPR